MTTRPDLGYSVGRCVLGLRAAIRNDDSRRETFWLEQLAYARRRAVLCPAP